MCVCVCERERERERERVHVKCFHFYQFERERERASARQMLSFLSVWERERERVHIKCFHFYQFERERERERVHVKCFHFYQFERESGCMSNAFIFTHFVTLTGFTVSNCSYNQNKNAKDVTGLPSAQYNGLGSRYAKGKKSRMSFFVVVLFVRWDNTKQTVHFWHRFFLFSSEY